MADIIAGTSIINNVQASMSTARIGGVANNTSFEADGTLVMSGDATVWDDLRFAASGIDPAGSATPMTYDNTNIGYVAGATGTQAIAIIAQMPHAWKVGSSIYPHIHWEPTTTNTGNVLWRMEYKWSNIGGNDAGAYTPLDKLQAGDGVAYGHQLASFAAISGAGKTLSSILTIVISRIGGDASDTYTGSALLKEFDIHYEMDTLGSRAELTK